ncbi:GapA-binding peptide SR1P [Paenibacillus naphthalenovorans]|uniref:GapA-binding peptide SR1P n=1 Tax=Paenibacillus naphthalenovorans TaxID=162209 RepID=UPI003D2DCBBB
MERSVGVNELHLGTILCKHCQQIIGTQETRKVTVYYSECPSGDCVGRGTTDSQPISSSVKTVII